MLRFTLFRKLKKVNLTDTEKAQGLAMLKDLQKDFPSNSVTLIHMNTSPLMRFAAVGLTSLVVVAGIGGTALAAEKSLPGDLLYPVKVKVSEPIRAAFKIDAEAEAKWEAELAARRLTEAERLEQLGRLNAETKARVEAQVEAHTKKTEDRIAVLKADGQTEAALKLEAQLDHFVEVKTEQLHRLKVRTDAILDRAEDKQERKEEKDEMKNSTSTTATVSSTPSTTTSTPDRHEDKEKRGQGAEVEVDVSGRAEVELPLTPGLLR